MWNKLAVVTKGAAVFDIDDAKKYLRVDHDDDDDLITSIIDAATAYVDGPNGIGIALMSQTWEVKYNYFPCEFSIPLTPVSSVTHIKYFDPQGAEQTLSSDNYELDKYSKPSIVKAKSGYSWPAVKSQLNAVTLRFVAGYASAADIPQDLILAIKLILGTMYSQRESSIGTQLYEFPFGVQSILDRHRVGRFA